MVPALKSKAPGNDQLKEVAPCCSFTWRLAIKGHIYTHTEETAQGLYREYIEKISPTMENQMENNMNN